MEHLDWPERHLYPVRAPSRIESQCPQNVGDRQTESEVPVTLTQQFVVQSEFWVHDLWHASAPVLSNVEQA